MKCQVHNNNKMINKKSKIILSLLTIVLIFNIAFVIPNKVGAQGIFHDPLGWIRATAEFVWKKTTNIYDSIKKSMTATAYKKALGTFLNNLAYDAAVDLAEGAAGRKSKFYTSGWESYLKNAGDAAAGEFLVDLGNMVSSTGAIPGLDICAPKNPSPIWLDDITDIQMNMFAIKSGEKKQVKCTLSDMADKWGEVGKKYAEDPMLLFSLNNKSLSQLGFGADSSYLAQEAKSRVLRSILNPQESDVKKQISISETLEKKVQEQKELAEKKRQEDAAAAGGNKTPEDSITEGPEGPPAETKAQQDKISNKQSVALEYTEDPVADSLGVFIDTLSNRLFGTLMKSIYKKLMNFNIEGYDWSKTKQQLISGEKPATVGDYIDQLYSTVKRISFNTNISDIDLIGEMQMTMKNPQSGMPGNLNDSVIDSDFAEVLRRAQTGNPMTLNQAMKEGLISEGKIFGFTNIANNELLQQPDLDQGISYDNMKKLRKNRVIPVGWEMAALKIVQSVQEGNPICPATGCTLKDVVNQYNQYGTYKYNGQVIKDNVCGWRSYPSINISKENCTTNILSSEYGLEDIEVKWVGNDDGNGKKIGICYKYTFDEDGFLSNVEEQLNIIDKDTCLNMPIDGGTYYEWLPGGCLIKEKGEAPLCGLVNPEWVLKVPIQKCYAKGYYSALEMNESSNRYEECADPRQCIKEDENGKCIGGYGYCLREKNIWRFKGDACDKNYSGCTLVMDDEKKEQSYLVDTLRDCPQEQVGCRKYLTEKQFDESYQWNIDGDYIYLNSYVKSCEKSNEGCTNFIDIKRGVNLIPNGSFEIDEGREDGKPDGWNVGGSELSTNYSVSGRYSLKVTGQTASINVKIPGKGSYILSYYVRGANNAKVVPSIDNRVLNEDGSIGGGVEDSSHSGSIIDDSHNIIHQTTNEGTSFGNSAVDGSRNIGNRTINEGTSFGSSVVGDSIGDKIIKDDDFIDGDGGIIDNPNTVIGDWTRKHFYYSVDNNSKSNVVIALRGVGEIYLDNVQFEYISSFVPGPLTSIIKNPIAEQQKTPSQYSEYGNTSNVFFKKAPDYYNCKSNNPASECVNYSKYCSKEDAGCESYNPVNRDPSISAVISEQDVCPRECNNFQTYSQLPNYFDKLENPSATNIDRNFITSAAKDCSEPSCEEFTNIAELEKGGEGKEYYKSLRQCVRPDEVDNITVYYTWEGSDTFGFQLKTWKLLKTESSSTNAPCTKIGIGESVCSDGGGSECSAENLDCREYYDMNANLYKRLSSKTIPISDECINLRRTNSNVIYKAIPSMSQTCSKSNVGCLEYKGNNGNNVKNILQAKFDAGTINPWTYSTNVASAYPSTESLQYGGMSMALYTTDSSSNSISIFYDLSKDGEMVKAGKEYVLSFWVKKLEGDLNDGAGIEIGDGETEHETLNSNKFINKARAAERGIQPIATDGTIEDSITSRDLIRDEASRDSLTFTTPVINNKEWEFKQLSIVTASHDANKLIINIRFTNSNHAKDGIFIDNITLKEFSNNFYKIKDSWNTPRICVDSDNNGLIDNKYLGCKEYKKRDNSSVYLYQFNQVCNPENIGCRAVIDTKNSSMPFKQTFNAYCNNTNDGECAQNKHYYLNDKDPITSNVTDDTTTVPEDTIEYIIVDNKFKCSNDQKGCQNLATLDNNGNPSDVFRINNPDNYTSDDFFGGQNQILCLSKYQNCVAFKKSDGGYLFKIHPREKVCEYKEAELASNLPAGYYKVGTSEPCDGLLYNKNYDNFVSNIESNLGSSLFLDFNNSYSATCPKNQNSCTAFIDPEDNLDQELEMPLSLNNAAQWKLFNWNLMNGTVSYSSDGSFNALKSSDVIEFNSSPGGLAVFTGGKNTPHNFFVEQNQVYKLNAFVRFDPSDSESTENQNRFISTFLICKKEKADNSSYYYTIGADKIPYAMPNLNSNYFVKENNGDSGNWKHIYGLYTMEPDTNFCNVAFYFGGGGGEISMTGVKFQKVQGYYTYLDNNNIDRTSCNEPSKEKGCILFHQLTDSTLRWNANKSYARFNLSVGDSSSANDSNIMLRVVRDRTCGEWATCASSIKTVDEKTGQDKNSCISLVACNSLSSDNSKCDNYLLRSPDIKPLTLDSYQKELGTRLSWSNMEYSGYSIPGLFPIDALSAVKTETETYELGKTVAKRNASGQSMIYKFGLGMNPLASHYGDKSNDKIREDYLSSQHKSCRLYPEKDSPFVWTPAIISKENVKVTSTGNYYYANMDSSKNQNFQNANICQPKFEEGQVSSALNHECDCSYTKVNYGSSKSLYFPLSYGSIPESIQDEYSGEGTTIKKKSQTDFIGWRGFCLEKDNSFLATPLYRDGDNRYTTRCLSWYPVDVISGEMDLYSVSLDAKVPIPTDSKVCLVADDYVTEEDRLYCAYWSSNHNESSAGLYGTVDPGNGAGANTDINDGFARCNVLAYVPAGTKLPQNRTSDFYDYFTNPDYYWPWSGSSDKFQKKTIRPEPIKEYEIIYGSDWPEWYEQNVYYDGFDCNVYAPQGNNTQWREKERKFTTHEFGDYELTGLSDKSFLEDFKSLLPKHIINQPIRFYYYDEGVMPNGSTYVGDGANLGVYEWDDTDATGYRANVPFWKKKNQYFIPLSQIARGYNSNSGNCGSHHTVGLAYQGGCLWAGRTFGFGEDLRDKYDQDSPIEYDGSVPPNGHEVFTDCNDSGFSSESIWNPLRYNYYVHYDWSFDNVYPECEHCPDLYRLGMTSVTPDNFEGIKACRVIGVIDGEGDSDAVFHSDNYYINTLPTTDVKNVNPWNSSICSIQGNNTCSSIIVGTTNYDYDEFVLRVSDIAQDNPAFNGTISKFGFSSGDNLREPIMHSSTNFQSFYFPYSIHGFDNPIRHSLQQASNNLRNAIVKIPEIQYYEYGEQAWIQGQWKPYNYNWDFTGNIHSNGPIIKQVTQQGEGETGITINNSNSNIYAVKNLTADISFYAYAQWGRSPIKEVRLDWYGDGSDILLFPGPFKNKKAKCIRKCANTYSEANWSDGDDCKSDSDCTDGKKCFSYGWGNDPKSCSEDKFNYSFIYVCTPDSNSWFSSCEEVDGGPCCKFSPKVTVTDSWGGESTVDMGQNKYIIIKPN